MNCSDCTFTEVCPYIKTELTGCSDSLYEHNRPKLQLMDLERCIAQGVIEEVMKEILPMIKLSKLKYEVI